jgi:hypothetical protein
MATITGWRRRAVIFDTAITDPDGIVTFRPASAKYAQAGVESIGLGLTPRRTTPPQVDDLDISIVCVTTGEINRAGGKMAETGNLRRLKSDF